jgi:acetylcholinesterase
MSFQSTTAFLVTVLFIVLVSGEIVEIENGKVNGTLKETFGTSFIAFYRIPFAKPPLGELRFKAPQPVDNWDDIRDATQPGPMCHQMGDSTSEIPQSEDCLHLNVYTRNLTGSKPVLVWFHGGAFEMGSGLNVSKYKKVQEVIDLLKRMNDVMKLDFLDPFPFVGRDIVLVTFNYRLGALGFLAMGTAEVPGNAAMKDQVMALRWVQKNIHKFGGNKNLVTLFGYSAGGFSVSSHLASQMSADLFHRATVMSGAITTTSELSRNNLEAVEKLRKKLNCDEKNVLECLRQVWK